MLPGPVTPSDAAKKNADAIVAEIAAIVELTGRAAMILVHTNPRRPNVVGMVWATSGQVSGSLFERMVTLYDGYRMVADFPAKWLSVAKP